MIKLVRCVRLFLATGMLFSMFSSATQGSTPVQFVLESGNITLGEPVVARMTINNDSSEDLTVDLGDDRVGNIMATVVAPDGTLRNRPQASLEGIKFAGTVKVAPRATYVTSIVLSDWFTFNQIGTYRVALGIRLGEAQSKSLVSESFEIVVSPRDEVVLRSRCAALVKQGLDESNSAEKSITAARELADIQDPVAVPFLVEMLEHSRYSQMAILSLARLNSMESADALIKAAKSQNKEISSLAHSALVGLSRTAEEPVRSTILQALSDDKPQQ